uniref:ZAD domain-containing protein n=1 Tax=Anopheles minimus TaxID=112268 RepID=A0A182WG96_9DIPT
MEEHSYPSGVRYIHPVSIFDVAPAEGNGVENDWTQLYRAPTLWIWAFSQSMFARRRKFSPAILLSSANQNGFLALEKTMAEKQTIPNSLNIPFPVKITPEDGLPTVVCSSCRDQLESCHRFRRVAHRTQKSLQSYLSYSAALAGSEERPSEKRNHRRKWVADDALRDRGTRARFEYNKLCVNHYLTILSRSVGNIIYGVCLESNVVPGAGYRPDYRHLSGT